MIIGKKKEKDVEIPSASLADIVFLLLIFFLVTTSIDTEKGLDLVLPPPGDIEIKIPPKNITNLFINAAGQAMIDNEVVDVNQLAGIIKEKLFENPLLIVSLKTHKDSEYNVYVHVLDQLKKAGAKRISLADTDKE
ncbi:MAG TPA: biopolymer transporter ExbD [Caldithrix abyssi]|uniref:Biopolymer transporter ExbD n=1 Tax=Caldithrix abyssi TaxID=187145 RepID=A0A7V1PTE4_CALAY|nr:biopolymer transporter ExbD [Caldithrix abyssi]